MLSIPTLVLSSGEELINVPCEEQTLRELGLTAAEAAGQVAQTELNHAWSELRAERNEMLSATDWTQVPDSPLTDAERTAWADYRQQLRDITTGCATPADVVWPVPPGDLAV